MIVEDIWPAINPNLDLPNLSARFAENRRLQIPDFLERSSAEALRDELSASDQWRHVINSGDKIFETDRRALDAMGEAERTQLHDAITASATRGFQFRYDAIRVPDRQEERALIPTHLSRFAQLMSAPMTLARIGTITGVGGIDFADAQATSYRPGDFLTRHDDAVAGKHRMLAYVLGLTEGWQAEWGGLLIFTDARGDVIDTIVPRFNALSLFTVPQPHSVTYVAPFAVGPRISVTGWLRSAPPPP